VRVHQRPAESEPPEREQRDEELDDFFALIRGSRPQFKAGPLVLVRDSGVLRQNCIQRAQRRCMGFSRRPEPQ
jgi:hypothetical protein